MNKIALVTGGNSGIGYATAKLLKEKKFDVHISGRNPDKVKKAAEELDIKFHIADMSDLRAINNLASYFLKSGIDVLVNNAGLGIRKHLNDITESDFSELFNVNVRGAFFLIRDLMQPLKKNNGCIVNVSSVGVYKGSLGLNVYGATKAGVDAFTRHLAVELAPNVRVNAVAPGGVDTGLRYKQGVDKKELDELKAKFRESIPLKRYGTPEEVAHVILAQIESTYVTGAVWIVDGGLSAM